MCVEVLESKIYTYVRRSWPDLCLRGNQKYTQAYSMGCVSFPADHSLKSPNILLSNGAVPTVMSLAKELHRRIFSAKKPLYETVSVS